MKRPSYRFGVRWIAWNDNPGDNESEEILAGYPSVALLADLFGVTPERVAKDICKFRNNGLHTQHS